MTIKIKGLLDKLQWFATGSLFLALGLAGRTLAQPLKPPPAAPDHEAGVQKAAEVSEAITQKMPKISDNKPKVLKFYAAWCGACKEFEPVIDSAKAKYEGKIDFQYVDVDDPANKILVDRFAVTNLPTTIYLDKDGDEVGEMIGFVGKDKVEWGVNMLVMDGQSASVGASDNNL